MAWASGYASSVFTMASDDTQLGRAVRSDSPSSLTAVGRAYRTPITIAWWLAGSLRTAERRSSYSALWSATIRWLPSY